MFYDRIRSLRLQRLDRAPMPGQLRFQGDRPLTLRGVGVDPGDVLIPGEDGRFACSDMVFPRIDPHTLPDFDALGTLKAMGETLGREVVGQPWERWLQASPLMPPVGKKLGPTALEKALTAYLPALKQVCRRPRDRLTRREERQPVQRCRRPSHRAPQVLAARSEDWSHRTLFGVRPKRILGIRRETSVDLYENRIVVGLIDRLVEALSDQIRTVRRVVQAARSMNEWSQLLTEEQDHRRANRICALWGQLWDEAGILSRAESRLQRLHSMRRSILSLKDGALYRALGGRESSLTLKMSNIFQNDGLYRDVAALWRAWEEHAKHRAMSPEERWRLEQDAAQGFERLSALLVVRAMDILGASPSPGREAAPFGPGSPIPLESPCGPLSLEWGREGDGLELRRGEAEPLRISTLPATLQAAGSPSPWIEGLPSTPQLILHLLAEHPRAPEATLERLQGPGPRAAWPVFTPVAPWALESTEGIARALRWSLWSPYLKDHPPRIPWPHPPWHPPEDVPPWLTGDGTRGWMVVRPPRPHEQGWTALDERIRESKRRMAVLEGDIQTQKSLRRRTGPLKIELDDLQRRAKGDEEVLAGLTRAETAMAQVLQCPICGEDADPYLFEGEGDTFQLLCQSCEGQWGVKRCGPCGARVPFILPREADDSVPPMKIDRRFGPDILAHPAGPKSLVCPTCVKPTRG